MQGQGCQKATQRVHNMKPNGMHIQVYVYRVEVLLLRHASTSQRKAENVIQWTDNHT